jgi:hypothetical protein
MKGMSSTRKKKRTTMQIAIYLTKLSRSLGASTLGLERVSDRIVRQMPGVHRQRKGTQQPLGSINCTAHETVEGGIQKNSRVNCDNWQEEGEFRRMSLPHRSVENTLDNENNCYIPPGNQDC